MLEFPTLDEARAWYADPDFEALVPLRHQATSSKILFVEGFEAPAGRTDGFGRQCPGTGIDGSPGATPGRPVSDTSEVGHRRDGRLEGTNNKLGVLKRIAFGFVNTDNFGRRALLQMPAMAASP
ncbi:MAG: DUF1330 domain-containing protein [Acidimicrobiia bacterium]